MARQIDIDASGAPTVTGTTWGLPDANRREWLYDVEQFSGEYLADGRPIWRKTITYSLANQTAGDYEVFIPMGLPTPVECVRMEAYLMKPDGTNMKPLPWISLSAADGTPSGNHLNIQCELVSGAVCMILRLSQPTHWNAQMIRATLWYVR